MLFSMNNSIYWNFIVSENQSSKYKSSCSQIAVCIAGLVICIDFLRIGTYWRICQLSVNAIGGAVTSLSLRHLSPAASISTIFIARQASLLPSRELVSALTSAAELPIKEDNAVPALGRLEIIL